VELKGARSCRQLLVSGYFSDGEIRDLTDRVKYFPTSRGVHVSASGRVEAVSDGESKVKVVAGSLVAWVKVTAAGTAEAPPISFKNEVVPILTKAGCNQGACHGAQLGKGGFKLSLLGFDEDADYVTIARQNESRRIVRVDPDRSLLLLKATLGVAHAGGMRFKPDSYEYRTLRHWIADNTPGPLEKEPEVVSLEAYPKWRTVRLPEGNAGDAVQVPQPSGAPAKWTLAPAQRLVAVARFQDGSTQDVTARTQFTSLNDAMAPVAPDGVVTAAARGQSGVMVRYRGQAAVTQLVAPYREARPVAVHMKWGFVDQLVARKWEQLGLSPSPPCTDADFIRRVYLDVLGVLPQPEAVRTFLASTAADKRKKLIDDVLARPEYVDYWTLKWGDLLRNHRDKVGEKGMWSFYNWLRLQFRENRPLDQVARELITAQGSTFTTGPANYYRIAGGAAERAETTAQVFLGVRLQCAKCHHHPFEKWTQDDYWQMAAFFARVGLKGSDEFGIFGQEQVVRVNPSGEVNNPRTGKRMAPKPLDGAPMEDAIDRRRPLAAWVTAPENPFFARNVVNRYWSYLMGRGLVDPVDDLRVTNPPSNPELLDALAKDFASHKFDVKHLLRTILNSEAYQLSSAPTAENKADELFHTKYALKRLGAEELLDAICFATGVPEKFPNLPAGMRAVQLPDPGVQNYFLEVFGRPERNIVCECERSAEPNMAQALHLMNSDFVQNKVAAGSGRVARLLAEKKEDAEIIEELYLVTFSRPPSGEEMSRGQELAANAPTRKEGLEDLLWALLNSREFLLKH